jgi:hypothetical protein
MKILDQGTQKRRKIRPYVDNSNISVSWNATAQLLEVIAPDNPHRHRTGGDYNTRRFHCVVQFTLNELQQIRDATRSAGLTDEGTHLEAAYEKLRDVAAKTAKRLLRAAKAPEKRPKPKNAKK